MVNNNQTVTTNINGNHPKNTLPAYVEGESRKIVTKNSLYDLQTIQANCSVEQIRLITDKCSNDVAMLGWDNSDVLQLIKLLTVSNYKDSEWCKVNGNQYYPCDAYTISCKVLQSAFPDNTRTYYIKLAPNMSGICLLIVSCHD